MRLAPAARAEGEERPNVLFILADDRGDTVARWPYQFFHRAPWPSV